MARYGDLDSQYFDDAGNPLVNGRIYFYETGTTTPKTTYADVNYEIPNTNPVILTAAGRQPNIFFPGVAKAILATSSGTQILTRDPVGETASSFGDPWVASKEYNANDVVQGSDGEFYVSLLNGNVNNDPVTSSGYWRFLYSVEWTAGTTYKTGAVVTYQTIIYQSLQNSNLNKNPSTETAWWTPINANFGVDYLSTVTASAATTVDIESGFSSTYDDYVIVVNDCTLSAIDTLYSRWKLGGVYLTTNTYTIAGVSDTNGSVVPLNNPLSTYVTVLPAARTAISGEYRTYGVNSSATKSCRTSFQGTSTSGAICAMTSGFTTSTAVLSGIRFYALGGATISGTFKLYGIVKS